VDIVDISEQGHRAAEHRYWTRMYVSQWAMIFVTAFAFGAAATYAYWAWRLDVIAARQRDLTEATERAYVNIQNVSLVKPFVLGNLADALIEYKNTGITPAKDLYLTITSGFSAATPANYTNLLTKCETIKRGAVLPPGVVRHIDTIRLGAAVPPNIEAQAESVYRITPKLLDDINSGGQTWTVGAWIRYHDQFGHCHATFEPFLFNPRTGEFDAAQLGFEQIDE